MPETKTQTKLLVFTDLDGCLLDPHNYQYQDAVPQIDRLKAMGIPVILCSSKTRAEMYSLWKSLQLDSPFIVENGAVVYIPCDHFNSQPDQTISEGTFWVREFGRERKQLQTLIKQVNAEAFFEFKTFDDLGTQGIAELTGLSLAEAANANNRQYSEPLHWSGSDEQRTVFVKSLTQLGASSSIGGRFLCVTGNHDKATATKWLRRQYDLEHDSEDVQDLAIGDSPNDAAMLEAAHTALVIPTPDKQLLQIDKPPQQTIVGLHCGPRGWSQGVSDWLAAQAISQIL